MNSGSLSARLSATLWIRRVESGLWILAADQKASKWCFFFLFGGQLGMEGGKEKKRKEKEKEKEGIQNVNKKVWEIFKVKYSSWD